MVGLRAAVMLAAALAGVAVGQESLTVRDGDMHVLSFERLGYPPAALAQYLQGIVVIQANLDEDGTVVAASVVYGPRLLAPAGIENIKRWRFAPNTQKRAVVVYDFQLPADGCRSGADLFMLQDPNFVTVTGCDRPAATAQAEPPAEPEVIVAKYEELAYPKGGRAARIQGVVVVRAKLDDDGNVVEARAVSGKEVFLSDCIANAKKWRFRPNAHKAAVIVYNFRLTDGISKSGCDHFMLEAPNFATITTCPVEIQ